MWQHQVRFLLGDEAKSQVHFDNTAVKLLWADNGDALAHTYTGTGSLKSHLTRPSPQPQQLHHHQQPPRQSFCTRFRHSSRDALISARRFYHNNFDDGDVQDGLNVLLGVFPPKSLVDRWRQQRQEKSRRSRLKLSLFDESRRGVLVRTHAKWVTYMNHAKQHGSEIPMQQGQHQANDQDATLSQPKADEAADKEASLSSPSATESKTHPSPSLKPQPPSSPPPPPPPGIPVLGQRSLPFLAFVLALVSLALLYLVPAFIYPSVILPLATSLSNMLTDLIPSSLSDSAVMMSRFWSHALHTPLSPATPISSPYHPSFHVPTSSVSSWLTWLARVLGMWAALTTSLVCLVIRFRGVYYSSKPALLVLPDPNAHSNHGSGQRS